MGELLDRPVSLRALALLRVLAGPVVLLHLWPFLSDSLDGHIYRDSFYEPYADWYPELPRVLYVSVVWPGAVAAMAMTLNILSRVTSATAFAVVVYNIFLSTTHFHSNRAYLVIVLAAVAVTPRGRDPVSPGWPLWLLRFEAAVVYGASGFSKLVDPDWFGGTVPWMRTVKVRDDLLASPLPGWATDLLLERSFHTVTAKVIVLTELCIAVGLWWPRTRYAAVWLAVCFHVAIQTTASVQVFSFLAIAALVVWAVPSTRDRAIVSAPPRLAALVRRLDWLDRFRIDEVGADSMEVVDRDGTVLHGRPARTLVFSRLPLTAWFVLPLRLVWR